MTQKRVGDYVVSESGRVWTLGGRELKTHMTSRYGVVISGTPIVQVDKLVAEAFIPNPKHLPCVHHTNCDEEDCHASNLEWCNKNFKPTFIGDDGKVYRRVYVYLDDNFDYIQRMADSPSELAEMCGVDPAVVHTHISRKKAKTIKQSRYQEVDIEEFDYDE